MTAPRIVTNYWPKPIPDRQFDWSAMEDGGDERMCGYGRTEQEAIEDLHRLLDEEAGWQEWEEFQEVGGTAMKIGAPMIWYRTINKYGHTRVVRVIVREIGEKVTVQMIGKAGKPRLFHVQPERLREVSQ
jgi:hypothetical protein